ncbi:hypothetical protein GCM10007160_32190 [Litchfieldella qijiaojingensis]|uniref:Uncharacterized protein n=1 Tax=Litchfieldella qijiaojingensis TaxID=980347 RepID=A0ABQ2Z5H5_9GAMM|nr:hypothetical protein [Halomonas qijiaojingensis]GGY01844.1 hypothetical protein GCM10007160_32190 [Halomonas qijiaojingensis]
MYLEGNTPDALLTALTPQSRISQETLKKSTSGIKHKAPGAQEPEHMGVYVRIPRTAQRSD